ncbi:hypothetical protein DOY81_014456 [Sarcophaga bullata]|nr:hypothetical protein DOY81_014456 [Sarcophaga bullata]
MQSSPRISLKSRGHILRNSMNDLEERLHNLEQSFKRPIDYGTSSSSIKINSSSNNNSNSNNNNNNNNNNMNKNNALKF